MGKDYYSILGVKKDATEEEMKSAYKKQALKWHPDRQKEQGKKHAEEMFKDVAEAYDVLSDKEKKRIYDAYGEEGLKHTGGDAGAAPRAGTTTFVYTGVDPSEVFSRFFGGDRSSIFASFDDDMGGHFGGFGNHSFHKSIDIMNMGGMPGKKKSSPLEQELLVSLEDINSGIKKKLKVKRNRFKNSTQYVDENVIIVEVKKGWKDGTKVTYSGEGSQESPMSLPGDLIFVIKTKPHPRFIRQGSDLSMTVPISLDKALVGFSLPIFDLENKELRITFDEVITPKTKKIIPNQGLPLPKAPHVRGNLIIDFDIRFPTSLDRHQKDIIKSLFT